MRKKVIAANWKMNKTVGEALDFVSLFLPLVEEVEQVEMIICPPFTALSVLKTALKGSKVQLGAQDIFWENQGAYTGEISPNMLLDLACSYVIIGHSERRQVIGESNVIINRKLRAAGIAGLTPLLCVGETLNQREKGLAREVVQGQLTKALEETGFPTGGLVIAYEPVWAIGTGVNASSQDAQDMGSFIREQLENLLGQEKAAQIPILYGGSVNPANIAQFMACPDIDGALVGGASLKASDFAQIISSAAS